MVDHASSIHSPSSDWLNFQDLSRPVRDVRTVYTLEHYLKLSKSVQDFKTRIFSLDRDEIEKYTRGQSINGHWFGARRHTITASTIMKLITALKKESFKIEDYYYKIEKRQLTPLYYPAIKWGQISERVAIHRYVNTHKAQHKDFEVQFRGLVHSESTPLLAEDHGRTEATGTAAHA